MVLSVHENDRNETACSEHAICQTGAHGRASNSMPKPTPLDGLYVGMRAINDISCNSYRQIRTRRDNTIPLRLQTSEMCDASS